MTRSAGAASRSTRTAAARERELEIRQMLDARNDRRLRRGEAALDVQAELERLTASAVDPVLAAEIRSLVIARNERRARAGKPALDVDTEVARQIERLSGSAPPAGPGKNLPPVRPKRV
jgi:hypothetical protein